MVSPVRVRVSPLKEFLHIAGKKPSPLCRGFGHLFGTNRPGEGVLHGAGAVGHPRIWRVYLMNFGSGRNLLSGRKLTKAVYSLSLLGEAKDFRGRAGITILLPFGSPRRSWCHTKDVWHIP